MSQDKQFFTTFVGVLVALGVLAIVLYFIAQMLTRETADYKSEEVILENIKPVGEVYIAGESEPEETVAAAPEAAAAATGEAAAAEPMSGEQIYQAKCMACHASGAAGAPKLGDAAAWSGRIGQGMDTMLANAINGLNAMPPKGLCMECSEDDLKAAIQYIVDNSK